MHVYLYSTTMATISAQWSVTQVTAYLQDRVEIATATVLCARKSPRVQ